MALLLLYLVYYYKPIYYVLKIFLLYFLSSVPAWRQNVSVQHNGGFLPGVIMLTQCYYHRGTHLNAMKMFCMSGSSSGFRNGKRENRVSKIRQ